MVGLPRLPFFFRCRIFHAPRRLVAQAQVEDFCKKGAKIEVLAPSNRWREAQVVRIGGGVAKVHYTGYDAQFDEEVCHDDESENPFNYRNGRFLLAYNTPIHVWEKYIGRKQDCVPFAPAPCCRCPWIKRACDPLVRSVVKS